ncbi:M56 family metallopeptidase [Ulvibacterium marinum]|uniref:M56 family metallopeptidase n=1 Tax=Ulvibacterium marinum TaxID=2419782 RepID=UPI002493F2DC|nr:M56 family metallopeptidase [Ulvibacterium marinum]
MLVYLLKSTASMAILFLFYKLLLEKESMHVFKRFFLLTSILVSLVIPSIVFVEYVEPAVTTYTTTEPFEDTTIASWSPERSGDINVINWPLLGWTVYMLGVLGFGFRFFKHLSQILIRINRNPKRKGKSSIKVLLQEQLPPHTFFRYIFLNMAKFDANEIPKEVILHEEVHSKQHHSIDVIFIEFMQVILWFNPMMFFFKKSIKLNHEFLADSAVLKKITSPSKYQNTLLSYLSQSDRKKHQSVAIANAITYSSIRLNVLGKKFEFMSPYRQVKKRFTVMKKRTSKKAVLLRNVLVLPIFALLLFAFSTNKEVIRPTSGTTSLNFEHTARSIEIIILKDGSYLVEGTKANKHNLVEIVNTLHNDVTPEIRRKIMNIHLKSSEEITREEVWFFYDSLLDYGFYRIVSREQVVDLSKGNKPLAIENSKNIANSIQQKNIQEGASRKLMAEYNAFAKKYNDVSMDERNVKSEDILRMEHIYHRMSKDQKNGVEPLPRYADPLQESQEGATPEQVAQYNALAKKYNAMIETEEDIFIKKSDVELLEYLHSIMTEEQKSTSEPFPDFPEPPKPPVPPVHEVVEIQQEVEKLAALMVEKEVEVRQQKSEMEEMEIEMERQEVLMKEQAVALEKQDKLMEKESLELQEQVLKMEKQARKMERGVPAPPPPPEPESPLEFVQKMKKKNAIFYHEGKKISADQAIKLLKNSNDVNINSKGSKGKRPIIEISTGPSQ